jgi:iron(III) transport system substrate-binding protein
MNRQAHDPPSARPLPALSRRRLLRLAGWGAAGAALAACTPGSAAAPKAPTAVAGAAPTAAGAASAWDRALAAARQEGRVIVLGPPGDTYRAAIATFQEAHPDVQLDFTGVNPRDVIARLLAERDAGQYLVDVYVGGPDTAHSQLKPKGALAPLKPALVRPDVLQDSLWVGGFDAGFMDQEGQYVYAFQGFLGPLIWVNRGAVPEGELSRFEQLLDPRWKGKIVWDDPRTAGSGRPDLAHLLMVLGEDFVRRLLQQDLVVTSDRRQLSEWLVRGTYPIAGGVDVASLLPFKRQGLGLNVLPLDKESEAGSRLRPGFGNVALFQGAPHPNAASVFVNWLLSKEAQTAWVRETQNNSRRIDVDGPAESAPDPKGTYRLVNHEALAHYQEAAQDLATQYLPSS